MLVMGRTATVRTDGGNANYNPSGAMGNGIQYITFFSLGLH
jgi:hypothetical protein